VRRNDKTYQNSYMKIKHILIIIFFANVLLAKNDWVYNLTNQHWIASAYVNSTNLVIKHPSSGSKLTASYDRYDHERKTSFHWFNNNDEEYSIHTNRVTDLFNGDTGVSYEFTPVSFTNQMIGFKIVHSWTGYPPFIMNDLNLLSNVFYVALSDTLVEVGEGDVEKELDIPIKRPEPEPDPNDPHSGFDFNW